MCRAGIDRLIDCGGLPGRHASDCAMEFLLETGAHIYINSVFIEGARGHCWDARGPRLSQTTRWQRSGSSTLNQIRSQNVTSVDENCRDVRGCQSDTCQTAQWQSSSIWTLVECTPVFRARVKAVGMCGGRHTCQTARWQRSGSSMLNQIRAQTLGIYQKCWDVRGCHAMGFLLELLKPDCV